jgi:beta-fructofuranosidase
MPPVGWLNDPNGLSKYRGKYHAFFQYSPDNPNGGRKLWGHYISDDYVHFEYVGESLEPDKPYDKNGVYSGSALIEDDKMFLYYTGNVKQEGDHDFTYSGREANTVLVTTPDGMSGFEKQLIMTNDDYPDFYTCHVRDPKVWKKDNNYYMVQGGRLNGKKLNPESVDKGAVLTFESMDMKKWNCISNISTVKPFGYMWECPDYMEISGLKVLGLCPQGLETKGLKYQNIYQAGYFVLGDDFDIKRRCRPDSEEDFIIIDNPDEVFYEWDYGFDFYAPQTFTDDDGNIIIVGWAGIPDADYDNEPTVLEGWQHALTFPRVISRSKDERKLLCNPLPTILEFRGDSNEEKIENYGQVSLIVSECSDTEIKDISGDIYINFSSSDEELFEINITKNNNEIHLSLKMDEKAGRGRDKRSVTLKHGDNLRILLDVSMVEIFADDGEAVMTSRFYFDKEKSEGTFDMTVKGNCNLKTYILNI